MLIPLLLGCAVNSLFPDFLQIGGATTGVLTSTNAFLGAFFVCVGANLSVRGAAKALKVGAVVTLTKLLVSVAIGLMVSRFMNDSLLGLSAVAVISGMSNSNGGMYTILTRTYGDDADQGSIAVVSMNDGPFFTMIALGTAGMANIPIQSLIAALIPLILGAVLGNVDPKMKKLLNNAEPVVMIFLAFAVGASMKFSQIIEGGLGGIVLGLMTLIVGGICTVFMDRITGGTGIAGRSHFHRGRKCCRHTPGSGGGRSFSLRDGPAGDAAGGGGHDRYGNPLPVLHFLCEQALPPERSGTDCRSSFRPLPGRGGGVGQ